MFFVSMAGAGVRAKSDLEHNNKIFKLRLKDVDLEEGTQSFESACEKFLEHFPVEHPAVQMTNGGTPFRGKLLHTNQGRGEIGGAITLINPKDSKDVEVLVHNLYGRRFNAPNDLVVHPTSGAIFWTDPSVSIFSFYLFPSDMLKKLSFVVTGSTPTSNISRPHPKSPIKYIDSIPPQESYVP